MEITIRKNEDGTFTVIGADGQEQPAADVAAALELAGAALGGEGEAQEAPEQPEEAPAAAPEMPMKGGPAGGMGGMAGYLNRGK